MLGRHLEIDQGFVASEPVDGRRQCVNALGEAVDALCEVLEGRRVWHTEIESHQRQDCNAPR